MNPTTNIYDNHDVAMPDNAYFGGNYSRSAGHLAQPYAGLAVSLPSASLTIKCCLPPLLVIRKWLCATTATPLLEDTSSRYTINRWMPTFGLVYKPWEQNLSLYANHTGAAAGCGADDGGQCRPDAGIAHSKQDEVGVKIDYGTIGGSLALFEIKKPNAISDTAGNRGLDGEQVTAA